MRPRTTARDSGAVRDTPASDTPHPPDVHPHARRERRRQRRPRHVAGGGAWRRRHRPAGDDLLLDGVRPSRTGSVWRHRDGPEQHAARTQGAQDGERQRTLPARRALAALALAALALAALALAALALAAGCVSTGRSHR